MLFPQHLHMGQKKWQEKSRLLGKVQATDNNYGHDHHVVMATANNYAHNHHVGMASVDNYGHNLHVGMASLTGQRASRSCEG